MLFIILFHIFHIN